MNRINTLSKWWKYLSKMCYLALEAIMVGVSNIIMEEDRSANDTRVIIEQKVVLSDEEE